MKFKHLQASLLFRLWFNIRGGHGGTQKTMLCVVESHLMQGLVLKQFKKPESFIIQITPKNQSTLPGLTLLETQRPRINFSSFSLNVYCDFLFPDRVRGNWAKVSLNLAGVQVGEVTVVINFINNVTPVYKTQLQLYSKSTCAYTLYFHGAGGGGRGNYTQNYTQGKWAWKKHSHMLTGISLDGNIRDD